MRQTLKSLWALFRIRVAGMTIYRLSFFTGFFVDCTTFLVQLLFLRLLTRDSVGPWPPAMYALFVGSFMTLDGLYMVTWFFGVLALPDMIRSGELDLVLVRPVRPLLYVLFSKVDLGCVPQVALGIAITLGGAGELGCLTGANVLLWLLSLLIMYALMAALSLLMRLSAFWTTSSHATEQMESTLIDAAMRLPMPAITGGYRYVLLMALPYGLAGNFPALVLAGQASAMFWLYAVAITAGFLALAAALWHKGLARYESASS